MTLTGTVVEGPFKGYEGGPNMIVQRIDGVATQEYIRVPIMGGVFEQPKERDPGYRAPMLFIPGNTYQIHVFETGVFVGDPPGADDGAAIQSTKFHMQN